MKKFSYTITDPVGMHARPASLLAKEIKNYKSSVTITKDGKTLDAGKVMMLMSMGIKCGEEVVIEVQQLLQLKRFLKAIYNLR